MAGLLGQFVLPRPDGDPVNLTNCVQYGVVRTAVANRKKNAVVLSMENRCRAEGMVVNTVRFPDMFLLPGQVGIVTGHLKLTVEMGTEEKTTNRKGKKYVEPVRRPWCPGGTSEVGLELTLYSSDPVDPEAAKKLVFDDEVVKKKKKKKDECAEVGEDSDSCREEMSTQEMSPLVPGKDPWADYEADENGDVRKKEKKKEEEKNEVAKKFGDDSSSDDDSEFDNEYIADVGVVTPDWMETSSRKLSWEEKNREIARFVAAGGIVVKRKKVVDDDEPDEKKSRGEKSKNSSVADDDCNKENKAPEQSSAETRPGTPTGSDVDPDADTDVEVEVCRDDFWERNDPKNMIYHSFPLAVPKNAGKGSLLEVVFFVETFKYHAAHHTLIDEIQRENSKLRRTNNRLTMGRQVPVVDPHEEWDEIVLDGRQNLRKTPRLSRAQLLKLIRQRKRDEAEAAKNADSPLFQFTE